MKLANFATKTLLTLTIGLFLAHFSHAATLGKFFVKSAPPDDDGFVDSRLEDSVNDLRTRISKDKDVELVTEEADADYLLVVISREEESAARGSRQNSMRLTVTLSVRDGDGWKPGARIVKVNTVGWILASSDALNDAKKWIKNQSK